MFSRTEPKPKAPLFDLPNVRSDEAYRQAQSAVDELKARLTDCEQSFYGEQDTVISRKRKTDAATAVEALLADPQANVAVQTAPKNLGEMSREMSLLRQAIPKAEQRANDARREAAARIYESAGVRDRYEALLKKALPILAALAEVEAEIVAFQVAVRDAGLPMRHGANPLNLNLGSVDQPGSTIANWVKHVERDGYKIR